MKTPAFATVALLTMLAHASVAEARVAPAKSDADADEAARVEGRGSEITEYNFDDDDVRGLVVRPEGMPVSERARARFPSLLSIRGQFVVELIRMAKDV